MSVRTATTGADGSYVAPLLPVGHYAVEVQAAGFKKYRAGDIDLHVSDRRAVDVTLQVGSTAESVDVTEAPAQIDLESATASGLLTGTQIRSWGR